MLGDTGTSVADATTHHIFFLPVLWLGDDAVCHDAEESSLKWSCARAESRY